MEAAGVPRQLYTVLASYLPMVLLSFLVGVALRRFVPGAGIVHLLVCAATWIIHAVAFLIFIYSGTDVSWSGEIPGVTVVPLGLLLAAFVRPPPSRRLVAA